MQNFSDLNLIFIGHRENLCNDNIEYCILDCTIQYIGTYKSSIILLNYTSINKAKSLNISVDTHYKICSVSRYISPGISFGHFIKSNFRYCKNWPCNNIWNNSCFSRIHLCLIAKNSLWASWCIELRWVSAFVAIFPFNFLPHVLQTTWSSPIM